MTDSVIEKWLLEASLLDLQSAMENGELNSEKLVQWYLDRIERYDRLLNSILELNPDALELARELDRERLTAGSRGPLHGIPVLLKDNIGTADRMHTSAGSIALANWHAERDSGVAARLRAAGAVFLGKTNMTEWANFMSSTMWAGYSSRGGLVLNPHGPGELFVGGSSSGSAAAVAAHLAAAAVGTETSGSIISPASQNNIVGLKPTVGLVSRSGIIPISITQDTAGPMTRTVTDAAVMLGVIAGSDERDAMTASADVRKHADYTVFLRRDGLRGARIGIPRYYYGKLETHRLAVAEAAIEVLRKEGAILEDPVELPCERTEWDANVMRYEFKKGLNDYLAGLGEDQPVRSLKELIAYNEANAERALRYGQDVLLWAEETSGTLTEPEYLASKALNREMARAQGIDYAIDAHRLDALLILGDEDLNDVAARAGYPSITVPGGYAEEGVLDPGGYNTKGPQGMTFIGKAYSEPTLLRLAYAFEQATRHRRSPILKPSDEK
jgi:amidase